jgi:hypothetical protein
MCWLLLLWMQVAPCMGSLLFLLLLLVVLVLLVLLVLVLHMLLLVIWVCTKPTNLLRWVTPSRGWQSTC